MWKFRRILAFTWKCAPRWAAVHVFLLGMQSLLPIIGIYLTKLIVDRLALSLTLVDKTVVLGQILELFLLVGFVTLLSSASASLSELVTDTLAQRLTDFMRKMLYEKAILVDLEYYESAVYQDTLQRAQGEITYRPRQILTHLSAITQSGITLVAIAGLLISLHWGIVVILVVASLPPVFTRLYQSRALHQLQRQQTPLERKSQYFGHLLLDDRSAKEVRLFNLGQLFIDRFVRLRSQLLSQKLAIMTRQAAVKLVVLTLSRCLIVASYGFMINWAIQGKLQFGNLALYYQAFQSGEAAVRSLLTNIANSYEDTLFLENIYDFLALKPSLKHADHPLAVPRPIQQGIEFKNVSFQYSGSSQPTLKNINLKLQPGEVIALVGKNGSGKTTLIKLLCRLYEPTAGQITIDDIELYHFAIDDLRHHISVIFQDYTKYHLTAQDNIWLGNISLHPADHRIRHAADRSGAGVVIQDLPQGYETHLGRWFERGEELSIGQWQKIALARAFLRDSQVIVLDEPTSAMDPQAEYELFQKFRELIDHQSAILITHRLSTVKLADQIYVMDRGEIVEVGNHDTLMEKQGVYAHLYSTQARSFQ